MDHRRSCEDQDTIESQVTRCGKIALATVWKGMVRWLYDFDNWEFAEGGDSYVSLPSIYLVLLEEVV